MKTKRSLYILAAAVGASILILASCNPLLTAPPAAAPAAAGSTTPGPGKGGVAIQVHAVSPVMTELAQKMQAAQASGKALSPKAYIGAGKVIFTVYDSGMSYVDSWTVYPTQNNPNDGAYNLGSWFGAVGNYTLDAQVYNQVSDETPAVTGFSTFSIGSVGQSPSFYHVNVVCIPYNPVLLTPDVPSDPPTILPYTWSWNYPSGMTIGSEAWFQVTASTPLTTFSATPTPGSVARLTMFVFNQYGNWVSNTWSQNEGDTAQVSMCSTVSGETYYVGVVDFSYTGGSGRTFTVKAGPSSLPSATPIDGSLGNWVSGTVQSGETLVYSFLAQAGQAYAVNWDDAYRGSGTQSADLRVSALYQDMSSIFSSMDSGWSGNYYYCYGMRYDSPFDATQTIMGTGNTVNIVIACYNPGSFRIKVNPYAFVADFNSYISGTDDLAVNGWATYPNLPADSTAQITLDPTGWGYGNVLEISDPNQLLGDPGVAIYSPYVDALSDYNLTSMGKPVTIRVDFYLDGYDGRWFTLAKTHAQAFVMNDPEYDIDAYANGNHAYLGVSRWQWYQLVIKINENPGTYSVYLYDRWGYPLGQLNNLEFNTENRDFLPTGDGDGRLFFGSFFDDYTGDASYGHVYIDNIRVLQE